jgi:hypothetical protein
MRIPADPSRGDHAGSVLAFETKVDAMRLLEARWPHGLVDANTRICSTATRSFQMQPSKFDGRKVRRRAKRGGEGGGAVKGAASCDLADGHIRLHE